MPKGVYPRNPNVRLGPKPCLSVEQDKEISRLYLSGKSESELAGIFQKNRAVIRKSLRRTKTPKRSKANYGAKNGSWVGGRRLDKHGYVLIRRPNHPHATKGGYVREHRLVMEGILGRSLERKEVVHHKNGERGDNRPENLVLFSDNRTHLAVELMGRCPKWTKAGLRKIAARRVPSMKGIPKSPHGTGARRLRRKLIEKSLRDTKNLWDSGPVAELPPLPFDHKIGRRKARERADR